MAEKRHEVLILLIGFLSQETSMVVYCKLTVLTWPLLKSCLFFRQALDLVYTS
jgi:hypothetical protein